MPDQRTPTQRTSVELFAGGGGLAMAVQNAGFRPLLLNEYVKHACDTLEANGAVDRGEEERIPEPGDKVPLFRGDVRDLKMGYLHRKVDLLAGGPPCQPFSLGGVAKGDEDKRNMFPEMFRAIREIQPKAVICENVRGCCARRSDRTSTTSSASWSSRSRSATRKPLVRARRAAPGEGRPRRHRSAGAVPGVQVRGQRRGLRRAADPEPGDPARVPRRPRHRRGPPGAPRQAHALRAGTHQVDQ
ncbi:DNA cytosine methyltransferase [Actinokineospora soli]|uniref:DNA cytosine methyltransferase n=1 Tax=Actinokineospora soli TaxID=1048753 RepID=A0ABW2TG75_9PSEU